MGFRGTVATLLVPMFAATILSSCASSEARPVEEVSGTVHGTVLDVDGRPFAGARVCLAWGDQFELFHRPPWFEPPKSEEAGVRLGDSGPDGTFRFEGLPLDGTYFVLAWATGRCVRPAEGFVYPTAKTPSVRANARIDLPCRLEIAPVDDGGNPISGARVLRFHYARNAYAVEVPEAPEPGRFVLDHIPPDGLVLEITAPGRAPSLVNVELAAGENRKETVRLEAPVSIRGVVLDETGNPVHGASVEAHPERWPWGVGTFDDEDPVTTGPDGRFEISGRPRGPHEIHASAPGFGDAPEGAARIVSAPAENVEIRLPRESPPCVVRFRLSAPPGSDPPKVLHYSLGTFNWLDGEFDFDPSPGRGQERFVPPGFAEVRLSWDVSAGETVDLGEIMLEDGVSRSGRVLDAEGRPVAGAEVWLVQRWSRGDPRTRTAEDGSFRMEHCHPESDEFSIQAEGFLTRRIQVREEGIAAPLDIVLRRGGRLRVRLLDAAGRPVPAGVLREERVDRPDDWHRDGIGTTDFRGNWEGRIAPGRFVVRHWDKASAEVVIEEGRTTEVVLRER